MIGGNAPPHYLVAIQNHKQVGLDNAAMEVLLESYRIDPEALRKDDFSAFYDARGRALCAMGKTIDASGVNFR
jgi:hypothetical protein